MRQPKKRSSGGFVFGIILVVFGVMFLLEPNRSGVIWLSPIIAVIVGAIIIYIYIRDTFLLKAVEVKQNSKAEVPADEKRSYRMQLLNKLYSIAEEHGGFEQMTIPFNGFDGITLVTKYDSFTYSFEQFGYGKPDKSFTKTAIEFAIDHGLLYSFNGHRDDFDPEHQHEIHGFDTLINFDKFDNYYIESVTVFTPECHENKKANKTTYKPI